MPTDPGVFRQAVERQVSGGLGGQGAGTIEGVPVGEVLLLGRAADFHTGVATRSGEAATAAPAVLVVEGRSPVPVDAGLGACSRSALVLHRWPVVTGKVYPAFLSETVAPCRGEAGLGIVLHLDLAIGKGHLFRQLVLGIRVEVHRVVAVRREIDVVAAVDQAIRCIGISHTARVVESHQHVRGDALDQHQRLLADRQGGGVGGLGGEQDGAAERGCQRGLADLVEYRFHARLDQLV
ncbi:Uncharacterised protein [Acinetobacter baumannii]|nr:Uncharacterised protein [Acinetobacter baumannii]